MSDHDGVPGIVGGSDESSSRAGNDNASEVSAGETSEGGMQGELNEFELDPEKRKEARKVRRVMANRRSARESRERRKKLLTDLQESVERLTAENAALTKENESLKKELEELLPKTGLVFPNVGLSSGSTQGSVPGSILNVPQSSEGSDGGNQSRIPDSVLEALKSQNPQG